ncbi:MAG: dihydrofolate reductase [Gemmatimonadales bacterium]|jgi:dihydrofolate reductase
MILSLIAAMAENRAIGLGGDLPWRLPNDMRRFKTLTTGHTVIMGRKTFDTLRRPLPERRNIIITRNASLEMPGAEVYVSLQAAVATAAHEEEVFVAGGAQIYTLALPHADRIYLTLVHAVTQGDTFFPEFSMNEWRLEEDIRFETDERHRYAYSFRLYERITG